MKKIFILVLSLISFEAFAQTPGGKIVVKKGQQFVVESSVDAVMSQEMMGQSMEVKVNNSTKVNAEVKDIKNNNYLISQTIVNVKSYFNGMGQDKSFDSDKEEDMKGELGAMYKDKINVPSIVTITNQGKNVTDTLSNEKQESNPMMAMMDVMGGGQQNPTAALFLVIPEGKKPGDSWQDSSTMEGVKIKRTYTLNSITNKEASVTMNGVIDIDKTMQVQNMDMKTAMQSKVNSAILVDLLSNVQKENKSTTDVTGTIDVMGQTVPVTAKVTTSTKVKSM